MSLTTYETRLTASLVRDGRSLDLYILQSPAGRVRIDQMDLAVWQAPEDLATWLEWCAARIREMQGAAS